MRTKVLMITATSQNQTYPVNVSDEWLVKLKANTEMPGDVVSTMLGPWQLITMRLFLPRLRKCLISLKKLLRRWRS